MPWISAFAGGLVIGVASALLLVALGRIAGISGILGALLQPTRVPDRDWRIAFLVGLLATGAVAAVVAPSAIGGSVRGLPLVIVAGLLVGFGTRLGGGCTSGHGVCGLGRISIRSLIAVVTFMTTGAIATSVLGAVS